jgi:purine-nucleoside phosphorylase
MTQQKKNILESLAFIKQKNPLKGKINLGLITYRGPSFLKIFKVHGKLGFHDVPAFCKKNPGDSENQLLFASLDKTSLVILNGRYNFFNGCSMRALSHPIYVLKSLGVKVLILIDEVGHLNPRFRVGEVAMIYDHINLMGDNPLIGENDDSIGPRFPDMSNAYDSSLYSKAEVLLIKSGFKFAPSVYLGITGPETETEAECRFYRDIDADVLGYSLVPENLAVVHCGLKCLAFGMISRELVADRLTEISNEEKLKNRRNAEKKFSDILEKIIEISYT